MTYRVLVLELPRLQRVPASHLDPNTAMLSIGDADELVPPLPGCVDGRTAGGLSKPGRIEGDVSLTRQDAAVGNAARFDPSLYDEVRLGPGLFSEFLGPG